MKLKTLFLRLSLLLLLALIGLWIMSMALPFWIGDPQMLGNAILIVLAWSLGSAGCAAVRERGKHPQLMRHAILAGGMTALGWTIYAFMTTIGDVYSTPMLWIMLPLTGWYLLLLYIGILSAARMHASWMIWLRRIAIMPAGAFLLHMSIAMNLQFEHAARAVWPLRDWEYDGIASRIGGVLGTLSLFFLLVLSLVAVLPRMEYKVVPPERRLSVRLTCPRCGVSQTIKSNGDRCRCCRLHIKVTPT